MSILEMAIPIVLSYAGQMLIRVVDSIMIGYVGTVSLAACSFANSVFIVVFVFIIGFSNGLTPLVGKSFAEKDNKRISCLLRNSLISNYALAIIMILVLLLLYNYLDSMGQSKRVVEESKSYYILLCISIIPSVLFFTFKQFLEGLTSTVPAMVFTLLGNLLNIGVNYVLIYGYWIFKPLGLAGAGIGTIVATSFMAIGLGIYLITQKKFGKFINYYSSKALSIKTQIVELFKIGYPIGSQMLIEVLTFAFAAIMIGWIGESQLAAHQIAMTLGSISYMAANGISAATTIKVSNELGMKKVDKIYYITNSSLHITTIIMLFSGVFFYLFREEISSIFVKDTIVINYAIKYMTIMCLFQLFDGYQVVILGSLRGIRDVNRPAHIAIIAYWLIGIPLGYTMAFNFNLNGEGIWLGLLAGLGIASLLLYHRFIRSYRLMKQKI